MSSLQSRVLVAVIGVPVLVYFMCKRKEGKV